MANPPKAKNNDNKTAPEKAQKVLSPKRQLEADHLAGKHGVVPKDSATSIMQVDARPDCGYCVRRHSRVLKREQATKRYLLANQK